MHRTQVIVNHYEKAARARSTKIEPGGRRALQRKRQEKRRIEKLRRRAAEAVIQTVPSEARGFPGGPGKSAALGWRFLLVGEEARCLGRSSQSCICVVVRKLSLMYELRTHVLNTPSFRRFVW